MCLAGKSVRHCVVLDMYTLTHTNMLFTNVQGRVGIGSKSPVAEMQYPVLEADGKLFGKRMHEEPVH